MRITLLAAFFALVTLSSVQAQKFGYINSALFVSELQEVKTANSTLEAFQTQKAKVIENMAKKLQEKAGALDQKKQAGTISPKAYEAQMTNLQKEQEKIVQLQQTSTQELETKRNELFDPILKKVNDTFKAVAKDESLNYIFDTSTGILLYADEALDVTDLVKAKYSTM